MPPSTSTTTRLLAMSNHLSKPLSSNMARRSFASRSAPFPKPPVSHEFNFSISPIPPNPLGHGKCIRTAAALIIGDEILNGKTLDKNSNYLARYCFEHGIELKRVEVIADDESEIVEASRRMVKTYDFVVTSGGIGPTHDDITYESLAKSFNTKLVHHSETLARMTEMNKHRNLPPESEQQTTARRRMTLFPETAEVLFIAPDIWVPVVRLEGKLCILPGIPGLFQRMLDGLTPFLPLPPQSQRPHRIQIFTSDPETKIAHYLTGLQERVKLPPYSIRVGSYPVLRRGVYVSLIGSDANLVREIAHEVAQVVNGEVCENEDDVLMKKEGSEGIKRREEEKALVEKEGQEATKKLY